MPDNLLLTKLFASNPRQAKLVFFVLGALSMLAFVVLVRLVQKQ